MLKSLQLKITSGSEFVASFISIGTSYHTCFSSKNLVRLNITPKKHMNMMASRVLFTVQIERASKGLLTTMNLKIKKKTMLRIFSTVVYYKSWRILEINIQFYLVYKLCKPYPNYWSFMIVNIFSNINQLSDFT